MNPGRNLQCPTIQINKTSNGSSPQTLINSRSSPSTNKAYLINPILAVAIISRINRAIPGPMATRKDNTTTQVQVGHGKERLAVPCLRLHRCSNLHSCQRYRRCKTAISRFISKCSRMPKPTPSKLSPTISKSWACSRICSIL